MRTVLLENGQKVVDEEEEVDEGLAELEKKKARQGGRVKYAVLAGLTVTEAMMCAPGLLYDMVKMKARQGGWKREWEVY